MVVHFWPAFQRHLATDFFTRRSNRSVPAVQSGPRMAAFMLSASMFTRGTARAIHSHGNECARPVSAEPVKETMSSFLERGRVGRGSGAADDEIAPDGKISAFTISSTIRWRQPSRGRSVLHHASGLPESSRRRSLFAETQAGKLNALMKTAAPFVGIRKCCPNKRVALRERKQGAFL